MPQGTRKCGCPARWCSCGKTVNKSELKNQPKVQKVDVENVNPEDSKVLEIEKPVLLKRTKPGFKKKKRSLKDAGAVLQENLEMTSKLESDCLKVEKRPVSRASLRKNVIEVKVADFELEKVALSVGELRARIKKHISRIRKEEALLEAYGGSEKKLRSEEELGRAKSQIHRSKLAIREAVHELESISQHGGMDGVRKMGHLRPESVKCAVCQSGQITPSNDILLCDGGCNRGFHQYCLEPAVTSTDMAPDNSSWLCPACDVKLDCIHAINKHFGTQLQVASSWKGVFPAAAEKEAAGTAPAMPQEVDWASDASEDEDFDPEREESGKEEEDGGAHEEANDASPEFEANVSDDNMDEDVSDADDPVEEEDCTPLERERLEDLIVEGKRQRTLVDYKILNFALFGFSDASDGSDEEKEGPSKKQRTEEPLFTHDVTGAPLVREDVSTPVKHDASPQVEKEPRLEPREEHNEEPRKELQESTPMETESPGDLECKENGISPDPKEEPEVLDVKEVAAADVMRVEPNETAAAESDPPKRQTRASKYWPELEDDAYNMLKSSFLNNQMPSTEEKQELSEKLKLPLHQVNRWFRSYRQKVLVALNRPADPEPDPEKPPGSKFYPPISTAEIAAEEAAERGRRLNMVLASTGSLRAALEKAAELKRLALENGMELDSEADSPTYRNGETGVSKKGGILSKLKRKAAEEGFGGLTIKKGKRTGYHDRDARELQSTLKRLEALDTRPLSVNGNRMGRPPIRMVELIAEVETMHGGQLPELLARRHGFRSNGRTANSNSARNRREGSTGEDLDGSDGSRGNRTVPDDSPDENGQPQMGPPLKASKPSEAEFHRSGSLNSSQSVDEDESGLEDSWVAALDKRPFSKNGKRMGRPSRQVKEAILQFRKEKQAAAVLREEDDQENTLDGRDCPLPKFTKLGKRIGRPPRALRKPEAKAAVLQETTVQAEPLRRSDSIGSLDGSSIGPDGVRFSKSGRRIGKPQRLGVVDPDDVTVKQEDAPPFRRMASSFDDLTAAIAHLEKPAGNSLRTDAVLDERLILSGLRARAASSNKLSAIATSSASDGEKQDNRGALYQEAQSPGVAVNGHLIDPLESLFTAAAAAHEPSPEVEDVRKPLEEQPDAGQMLMAVSEPAGDITQHEEERGISDEKEEESNDKVLEEAHNVPEPLEGAQKADGNGSSESGNEERVEPGLLSEALASGPLQFGSKFNSSSGDLAAMAASLMSPVTLRRPDRPPRKGGKRAFSSLSRSGSVPGTAGLTLVAQSSGVLPADVTS